MIRKTREVLSAEELAELKGLEAELSGLRKRWSQLIARLASARRSSPRAVVVDRLRCVLHDCLAPALRDLESIERNADENRAARRHPR
ncbi:MAG TPA: hypothetical protein VKM72_26095 [Thermoanaerobaculia bacterium]|nr:hypothetical protein [Thermoanaerobaculia bacterium]